MSKLVIAVVAILVIIAVAAIAIGYYVSQYDNLSVDVDTSQSSHDVPAPDQIRLNLVLVLSNSGSGDLYVPPTTFDLRVDGVDAGPGSSEAVTVPGGGRAWTTATVIVDKADAPLAYVALVDPGKDKITLDGTAHVDVGPFTLDVPFEQSFYMDV